MNLLIFIGFFVGMEFMAWFSHKYVMHGLLWNLHEDHHTKDTKGVLEKNDSFFVIFAVPAMLLYILGFSMGYSYPIAAGLGITAYGLCYFLVHDVFIHQRLKWFRNSDNFYFRAIRRAHKMHHKHLGKEHGECFGMLWVPLKYYKNELKK